MSNYKICVYAICKNEEQFVDRWMDAVSEADEVVVTDTGSTDGTVQRLRDRGATVYSEVISPWRFDAARNAALDHVPEDADICVPNDLDEVFEKGWRQKLEEAWKPQYTRARYLFTWSFHEDGTPDKQYPIEKTHRRHGFRWAHPVHEVLIYSGEDRDATVWVPGMVLNHYPDTTKPRSQYLPLLELSAQENPEDDRTAFWLGREYMFYGLYDKAIAQLKSHLALPSASWDEERSASMRCIARCFQMKGDLTQARLWMYKALAECPRVREPYLWLAKLGYQQGDWPLVFLMVKKALAIHGRVPSYLTEPESWGGSLYDLGAIAAFRLGLYRDAHSYAQSALAIAPDDERLKRNLELIEGALGVREGA